MKTKPFLVLIMLLFAIEFSCARSTHHVADTIRGVETGKTIAQETIEAAYLYQVGRIKAKLNAAEISPQEAEDRFSRLNTSLDKAADVLERLEAAERVLAQAAQLYRTNPNDPTVGSQINDLVAECSRLSAELFGIMAEWRSPND